MPVHKLGNGPERPFIPVTVEHVIGQIELDPDGEPAVMVGLRLIGAYETDHEEGGRYRVPLPSGRTLVADLTYEKGPEG